MAATNVSQQLKDYIQTMQAQGILDHEFDKVKRFQTREDPQFVTNVITMFKNDAQHYIALLSAFLYKADVDFTDVERFAHQLKAASSSIGGPRVSHVALQLQNASKDNNKQGRRETSKRQTALEMDLSMAFFQYILSFAQFLIHQKHDIAFILAPCALFLDNKILDSSDLNLFPSTLFFQYIFSLVQYLLVRHFTYDIALILAPCLCFLRIQFNYSWTSSIFST